MKDFRALAAENRWDEVNWIWLSLEEQSEFLQLVRAAVPTVLVENGMERMQRHCLPDEMGDDRALIKAATILSLGELEASVEGEPPDDCQIWSAILSETEVALNELASSQEVTAGAEALSRRQHVADALDYFRQIESDTSWMRNELHENEHSWLNEIVAAVAWKAFLAGRHVQTAFNKSIEVHAVRGVKTIKAASAAGQARKRNFAEKRKIILCEMNRLIDKGYSVRNAARLAHSKGLGTSKDANLQLWTRYKPIK